MKETNDHVVEFFDVKRTFLDLVETDDSPERKNGAFHPLRKSQPDLQSKVNSWRSARDDSWDGCSLASMRDWIRNGYRVPGMHNAGDVVPMQEKRKLRFAEEGELQIDMATSGHDTPFLEWTRREARPGLRVEIEFAMSAATKASVVGEYATFLANALSTFEANGFDLEVNVVITVEDMWFHPRRAGITRTLIRVKKENEVSDFTQWSALFSPGGFRMLGFCAMYMHADASNAEADGGLGIPQDGDWTINFDANSRTMHFDCPVAPRSFPLARMVERVAELGF